MSFRDGGGRHGGVNNRSYNGSGVPGGGGVAADPPQALPENPLKLIDKRFIFKSRCVIPLLPSCSSCSKKGRSHCACVNVRTKLGTTPAYELTGVQKKKNELNNMRSKLDDLDIDEWKAHTGKTITTNFVVPDIRNLARRQRGQQQSFSSEEESAPEMVTNAWCKLYEILRACQFFDVRKTLEQNGGEVIHTAHLCECPGGFICATNHFIKTEPKLCDNNDFALDWRAVSLNPYFEGNDPGAMIDDDAFYRQTHSNWLRGADDSGNIKSAKNIQNFFDTSCEKLRRAVKKVATSDFSPVRAGGGNVFQHNFLAQLVTADGSIDVQFDANRQEAITAGLHFAELVAACNLLRVQGSFVLKMFTIFEHHTMSILGLMSTLFEELLVLKPEMSRWGSGETYVVGRGFNGISSALLGELKRHVDLDTADKEDLALFPREWIPDEFVQEFETCGNLFAQYQIDAIKRNFDLWESRHLQMQRDDSIQKERQIRASAFISKFAIRLIKRSQRLVPHELLTGAANNSTRVGRKQRVGGLQIDRLVFRTDFVEFQAERAARAISNEVFTLDDPSSLSSEAASRGVGNSSESPTRPAISGIGMALLEKMGWKPGEGLGASGTGEMEAVKVSFKQDTKGLRSSADTRLPSAVFSPLSLAGSEFSRDHNRSTYKQPLSLLEQFDACAGFCIRFLTKFYKTLDLARKPLRVRLMPRKGFLPVFDDVCRRLREEDEGGANIKNGGPVLEGDWITKGYLLPPHEVKISRFIDQEVFTKLLRQRVEPQPGSRRWTPMTIADCFMLESGKTRVIASSATPDSSVGDSTEQATDSHFRFTDTIPSLSLVALVSVLQRCSEMRCYSELTTEPLPHHFLHELLPSRYTLMCEITLDTSVPLCHLAALLGTKCGLALCSPVLFENYVKFTVEGMGKDQAFTKALAAIVPPKVLAHTSPLFKLRLDSLVPPSHPQMFTFPEFAHGITERIYHLVTVDPFPGGPAEQELFPREYADSELRSKRNVLAMCTVAMQALCSRGDLVLRLRSSVTRFTVSLILCLSLAFASTVVFRPVVIPAWTSCRYVIFRAFDKSKGDRVKAYLEFAFSYLWSARLTSTATGAPDEELMALLPPLFFTHKAFNEWTVEWNSTLAEEELTDLLARETDDENNSSKDHTNDAYATREARQQAILEYLESVQLRGFFYPQELSPEERCPETLKRQIAVSGVGLAVPAPVHIPYSEGSVERGKDRGGENSRRSGARDYYSGGGGHHLTGASDSPYFTTGANCIPVGPTPPVVTPVGGGPLNAPSSDALSAAAAAPGPIKQSVARRKRPAVDGASVKEVLESCSGDSAQVELAEDTGPVDVTGGFGTFDNAAAVVVSAKDTDNNLWPVTVRELTHIPRDPAAPLFERTKAIDHFIRLA